MLINQALHSQLELRVFIAHLFKGLWHAPIHEPLAVLISVSET